MNEIRCKIEVRETEGQPGPGRVYGELMHYGKRATDRPEIFEPGSLAWAGGIVLNRQHERSSPILRFEPRQDGDKILIDAPLPDTQAGRDAALEIRAGLFRGISIEFEALKESTVGGIRRIRQAALAAAALVDDPSYPTTVEVRGKARRRRLWL